MDETSAIRQENFAKRFFKLNNKTICPEKKIVFPNIIWFRVNPCPKKYVGSMEVLKDPNNK